MLFTRSGLEISVAATKTFASQVAAMYLLALRIAEVRGALDPVALTELVSEVKRLPNHIEALLARPLADASQLGLSERAQRDVLRVITASYEYHGGFRLRTLSA